MTLQEIFETLPNDMLFRDLEDSKNYTVKELKELYKNEEGADYRLIQVKFNYGKTIKQSIRWGSYGIFNEV
ncbi:MAG: hypothetical protein PHS34_09730 [Candidatus Omnitrophica bacterium]|jgi:hypothetical protein|nr:hypothetical protein [Candidatus Omnitrophota bacterium]